MELTIEMKDLLKKTRKDLGMTRQQCVDRFNAIAKSEGSDCSLTADTLNSIETRPNYNTKEKTLHYLCKVLGLSVGYVLGYERFPNEEVRKAMCGFTKQEWMDDCAKALKQARSQNETADIIREVLSLFDIGADVIPDEQYYEHYRESSNGVVKGLDVGTQKAIRTNRDDMRHCIPAPKVTKLYGELMDFIYKWIDDFGEPSGTPVYMEHIGGYEHWEDLKNRIEAQNSEEEDN